MNPRPILIALGCVIALVVGAYLFGNLYFDQNREEATPTVTTDKPGPTAKGHINGDVWHDETNGDSPSTASQIPLANAKRLPKRNFPPLTDAERELLKKPLPPLDENGKPPPMDSLTEEEQQRAQLESRLIVAELYDLNIKAGKLLSIKRAGGALTEEEDQWLTNVYLNRAHDLVNRLHETPNWGFEGFPNR